MACTIPISDVLATIATYLGDGQTYAVLLLILLIGRQWRPFLITRFHPLLW